MPWNEPGSSNQNGNQNDNRNGSDRDPWNSGGNQNGDNGRRGKDNGPPDLDEVIKNITDKINNMFGSKGGSGGGGDNNGPGRKTSRGRGPNLITGVSMLAVLVIALVVWIVSGFYTVDERNKAVVLRLGKYLKTEDSGLHWRMRFIDTVQQVDVSTYNFVEVGYRTGRGNGKAKQDVESLMLTEDENIIDIEMAVQYNIKDPTQLLFNVVRGQEEDIVRQSTESAIREIVGRNVMDFALTDGRGPIAAETKTLLQEILDRYETGINVLAVEMQNAQPPVQVKAAFDDAVKAREDRERFKNQAEAYANGVVPQARGEAAKLIQEAEGYKASVISRAEGDAHRFESILTEYTKAPEVTRERLYIETMEKVLSSTSKLYIDQDSGNGSGQGSVFYLPLDKLVSPAAAAPTNGRTEQMMNNERFNELPSSVGSDASDPASSNVRPARSSR